ncbi:hypothetical protein ES703_69656 [subsurface metagenome]
MPGTYCTMVKKFERGQMFRQCCFRCVHNTAHLGDDKLYCRYLEYRLTPNLKGEIIPGTKPSIRIPVDLR